MLRHTRWLSVALNATSLLATLLLTALPAHAALEGRTINGAAVVSTDSQAAFLYDTDLDITWLRNANAGAGSSFDNGVSSTDGKMGWANANAWADSLTTGGFTDWRLPTALNANGSVCQAYNCSGSEVGHLWYTELGNTANTSNKRAGSFLNLQNFAYWTGTPQTNISAWSFDISTGGVQGVAPIGTAYFAMAVRTGDVLISPVPEPESYAMLLAGLAVLGATVRNNRKR
jgi:hypothetical protein